MLPEVNPNAVLWNISGTHQLFLLDRRLLRTTLYALFYTRALPPCRLQLQKRCGKRWLKFGVLLVGRWPYKWYVRLSISGRLPRRGNSLMMWQGISFKILSQGVLHHFPRSTFVAYPLKIISLSSFIAPLHGFSLPMLLNFVKAVHTGDSPVCYSAPRVLSSDCRSRNASHGLSGLE